MSEELSKTGLAESEPGQSETGQTLSETPSDATEPVQPAVRSENWKLQNQIGRNLKPMGEGTEQEMRKQFERLKAAGGIPGSVQLIAFDGGIVEQFGSLTPDSLGRGVDLSTGKEYSPAIVELGYKPVSALRPEVMAWLEALPETPVEEGKENEGVPPCPGAVEEEPIPAPEPTPKLVEFVGKGQDVPLVVPPGPSMKFLEYTPPSATPLPASAPASAPVLGVAEHMPRLEAPAPTPIEPTDMTAAEALMHIKTLFKAQKKQVEKMERKFYKELYTMIGKAQARGKPFDGKLVAKAYVATLPKPKTPRG